MQMVSEGLRAGVGAVVEFGDGRPIFGVVLTEPQEERVEVLSQRGDRRHLDADRLRPLELDLALKLSDEQLSHELQAMASYVGELAERAQLEEIWRLCQQDEQIELELVASLLFGQSGALERAAARRVLRQDRVYFSMDEQRVCPRTSIEVERARAQVAAELERQRDRLSLIDGLIGRLEHPSEAPFAEHEAEILAAVANYAAFGDELSERREATSFVDDFEQRAKRPRRGPRQRRARRLLVELGYWPGDESYFLHRNHIERDFAPELLAEAEALGDGEPIAAARRDLSGLLTLTIDDAASTDLDDALSAERLADGWRLWVHISSPTSWLQLNDPLAIEARARGASVYLPTDLIPMFPACLSEGLFSLQAGVRRPCLSFYIDVDDGFEVGESGLVQSWIEVDQKLSYTEADELIELDGGPVGELLRTLHTIADMLQSERAEAGAIFLPIPNPKVRVVGDHIEVKTEHGFSPAHEIVSEAAVAANSVAAQALIKAGLAAPFRTQEPPREAQEPSEGSALARAFAMRRRMLPVSTETRPAPHSSLGVAAYVYGTSPIRRYQDILTHYQLEAALGAHAPLDEAQLLDQLRISQVGEGFARTASREAKRFWLLSYLEAQKDSPQRAAIVDFSSPLRAHVVLLDTMLRATLAIPQAYPLGSLIEVDLERVSAQTDQFSVRFRQWVAPPPADEADF